MKCKTCPNTDQDTDFFVAMDEQGSEVICGKCIDKMYSHYIEYALKNNDKPASTNSTEKCEIPSTKNLVEYLDQYIVGQRHAKKDIAVAVRNHYKRLSLPVEDQKDVEKSNILIMGESGTGKTAIIQHISDYINVPMVVMDCTSMSASGYTGDDVESCIKDLYSRSNRSKELTERGIVFLDEIDKKKKSKESKTADVGGEDVQKSMLRLLEGKKVKVSKGVEIDTRNILFIAGGAFVGLEKIVEHRLQTNSIGFGRAKVQDDLDMADVYKSVHTDDLVEFGMIPELIGRLPVHTYTNTLSKEDIVKVMTETKNSVVKQFEKLFAVDDVKLTFKSDAVEFVAEKVIKDKIGVRGLRKVLESELRNIQFDIEDYRGRNIRSVTVTTDKNQDALKTKFGYYKKSRINNNDK